MLSPYKYFSGNPRTRKAQINIISSFGIKAVDVIVQFLLVPVTLGYLNEYEYGIWLTLNSILVWINSFDIGLGNGLRNQLASALSTNNTKLARELISTAYGMIIILMLCIFAIGSIILHSINWYNLLGASAENVPNLERIVLVTFSLFCINFVVKFIGNVYLALQQPAINNLLITLGHLLALISIVLLNHYSKGSLFSVAVIFSTAPIVVYLISYPITFLGVHKELLPNPRLFKSSYLKSLFSIGVLFFLLQISGIVLFAISNITISHLFGPDQVTPYNITYRYFSLAIMCMGIISSPMWSATTDARERGDIQWIRHSIEQIKKILFLSLPVLLIMTLVSPFVFSIWVRGVKIPFLLSVLMSFYAFIIMWSSSISNFLNGMGKLNLQIINTVTAALVFIPLCIVAGHNLGINGIVISMIIVNSLGAIINTIQLNKIVKGEASGIWNK